MTLVNGQSYSWVNVGARILGRDIVGCISIEYAKNTTKTNNYGMGAEPISRGTGKVEYSGSIEVTAEELRGLVQVAPGGDLSQIPAFPIIVSYLANSKRVTDTLLMVEFMNQGVTAKEGDTNLTYKLDLVIGGIQFGIPL